MKDLIENLRQEFHRSEDYRYAYDEEFANTLMATQIKVLRESHDPSLTQKQLAEKASMKQSRISELENVAYSAWSISTLRRLARALGVRLVFKFESWGELLHEIESFGRDALVKVRFEQDPEFQERAVSSSTSMSVSDGMRKALSGAVDVPSNDPAQTKLANVFNLSDRHAKRGAAGELSISDQARSEGSLGFVNMLDQKKRA